MSELHWISGGVTAPKGFKAAGINCGIRKNKTKKDLALIVSDSLCNAAAVYTQNLVQGAPIMVTKQNLQNGRAQAILCNSGNANTCNADGEEKANTMCNLAGNLLRIDPSDVIVASTGVIGQTLPIAPIEDGLPSLVSALSPSGSIDAAQAIMTTDTVEKEFAVEFILGQKPVRIGVIAKGSGMIEPNMATLLGFITTDAAITPVMLHKALAAAVEESFNMLSIDGDTSTNDMVCVLASGQAKNAEITAENEDFKAFVSALSQLCVVCTAKMAKDGEGATRLIRCEVSGADSKATAKTVAKSIINSSLVKTAVFGADANWGRILCAIGYAGCPVDVNAVDVSFASAAGQVDVCADGRGVPFSEETAKTVLSEDEITIQVNLKSGHESAAAFGCDLTYEYVKINGDYRT